MIEQSRRNEAIDFLRGFSISAVILQHCYMYMPLHIRVGRFTKIILNSGYHGVIVFFVISGFLITSHSLRKWGSLKNISCYKFYQMRFARILPCLLALVIILAVLHNLGILGFGIRTTSLAQAAFSALTFHINWLEAKSGLLPGNWAVLWSLSIEEMFYLFFPIICLITRKNSYFVLVMLVFVILGPFARTTFTPHYVWSGHSYLSCLDGIAIGCLSALFAQHITFQNTKIYKRILLIGTLFLFLVFIFRQELHFSNILQNGLSVSLLEMSTGFILIAMHQLYQNGLQSFSIWTAPWRWFGRNSYEIYLTHMFFVIGIRKIFFATNQSIFTLICLYIFTFVLSGICGQIVVSLFSDPSNRFLRQNFNRSNYAQEYVSEAVEMKGENGV